jgi:alpha-glucosidase (family GH31 glycosyl hydrolase)
MGGFEHNADPELYIRWVQFGMLSPLAMVFGMDHPGYKEPWNYGEDGLRNFKKYDSLRYTLLPYLYSHAYAMYKTGMPLMRALVLHYQDDPNVYNITDQYMLGDAMMICPVTTKGAQTRTVYLPKGNWVNYWSGETLAGARYYNILTPLDMLPIFIKAGSIIPMQPVMNYVGEKQPDVITLDIYPGANAHAELYEDDGKTLDYQKGSFVITAITAQPNRVEIQKPAGTFTPPAHAYLLKLHLQKAPVAIAESGKALAAAGNEAALQKTAGWYYDATSKLLWIRTAGDNRAGITVEIR